LGVEKRTVIECLCLCFLLLLHGDKEKRFLTLDECLVLGRQEDERLLSDLLFQEEYSRGLELERAAELGELPLRLVSVLLHMLLLLLHLLPPRGGLSFLVLERRHKRRHFALKHLNVPRQRSQLLLSLVSLRNRLALPDC
jgi:hypothetical protein